MEFLKPIFADKSLTFDEFVNACAAGKIKLADLSGGDYVAKGKFDAQVDKLSAANETVKALEGQLEQLKAAGANADALNAKVAELQKIIDDRKAADEAATQEAADLERFNAAAGEKKFINDFTKKGIFNEFRTAMADKANAGKADADIFKGLTENRDGLFESPQNINIPGMGGGADAAKTEPFHFTSTGIRAKPKE